MRALPPPRREPPVVAGRPPPTALDAEAACLSAVLLRPERYEEISWLRREHFYSEANGKIWESVRRLTHDGRAVDAVTVAADLRDAEQLGAVGGAAYLAQICDATPAVSHVADHARIVRETWQRRRLIAECQRVAAEGYGEVTPTFVADAARSIGEVVELGEDSDFTWLDAAELETCATPPEWVVRSMGLCPGRPSIFVGTGYSGKSWLALEIALSVRCGRPVLGQFDARSGRVVWLDYELGRKLTKRRIQRMCLARGLDVAEVMAGLHVACRPRITLTSDDAERALRRAMNGAKLLVIDSLRRAVVGLDENDSRITAPLDMLARLSDETGCAVLVLHHATTKTDPRAPKQTDLRAVGRGSSAIFDCAGSYVVMDGQPGDPVRVNHVREPQEGRLFESFYLRFRDVARDGDPKAGIALDYLTAEQVEAEAEARAAGGPLSKDAERVLSLLSTTPQSGNQIRRPLGLSYQRWRDAVDVLVGRGLAIVTMGPRDAQMLTRGTGGDWGMTGVQPPVGSTGVSGVWPPPLGGPPCTPVPDPDDEDDEPGATYPGQEGLR